MSDVRIKKSVLQSIIKKSLREGPRMDVERRITVGPDNSRLPSMLPLSPSDRMSTQLEIERPPVEDPEYSPSNPKELGFAVQALAEMVHSDQVEEVYVSFKQIIEKLEEEESDNRTAQIESMLRKHRAFNRLMREAQGDDEDDDDEKMTPEEEAEMDAIERSEATGPEAIFFKYENVLKKYGIDRSRFNRIVRVTLLDGRVSNDDLVDFLELLGDLSSDPAMIEKVSPRLKSSNERGLVAFISKFKDEYAEGINREEATKADAARPKFDYQSSAKPFGYAAASGLRQAFIRDILGIRAAGSFVTPPDVQRFVYNSIREAFEDAFDLPENQDFLKTLLDEDGLEEYKSIMKNPRALAKSALFQNFAGLVSFEALSTMADLNFKPTRRGPGRKIGLAFQTAFGDDNEKLQSFEEDQLEQMAMRGEYADFVSDVLDASEENGHRGILTAAASMSADDLDREETGSYSSPAFSTLKKAASVAKPPELHVSDYMGKDDPMVGQIKTADRAASKASKVAAKTSKMRRT